MHFWRDYIHLRNCLHLLYEFSWLCWRPRLGDRACEGFESLQLNPLRIHHLKWKIKYKVHRLGALRYVEAFLSCKFRAWRVLCTQKQWKRGWSHFKNSALFLGNKFMTLCTLENIGPISMSYGLGHVSDLCSERVTARVETLAVETWITFTIHFFTLSIPCSF